MPFPFRNLCPCWVICCFVLISFLPSAGQQNPGKLALFAPPTMKQLIQQSGLIFEGTVAAVEHVRAKPGQVAAQRITFRVEQAILGVRKGQLLEVREWAGLWNFGEHYRMGERVLLFLYPRSRLGLTSPVGGPPGRFDITSDNQVLLQNTRAQEMSAFRSGDPTRGTTRVPANAFIRAIQDELEESRGERSR